MIMGKVPKKIRVPPNDLQAYHELNFFEYELYLVHRQSNPWRLMMSFDQTFLFITLIAAIVGIAKYRLGYSWSYSLSRRHS